MTQTFDYNKIIDQAMRGIVKKCLKVVEKRGGKLPGNHHFYITFYINFPGVHISKNLAKMHAEQMTIVLQHQFWDLKVDDDKFSVVLSFNGVREKLEVPYEALLSFADPSARFGLQFNNDDEMVEDGGDEYGGMDDELFQSLLGLDEEQPEKKQKKGTKDKDDGSDPKGKSSKIISIDNFRKK